MQETSTENKTTVKNQFQRKARLGINPLTLEEGETRYFKINSEKIETLYSKTQEKDIPFVISTDLQTGEQGHFWLSGQLKHQFGVVLEKNGTLAGFKFEITHKGQKPMEIDGEKVKVNQYDLYELN